MSDSARIDRSTRRWYTTYKAVVGPVLRRITRIETSGFEHVPRAGPFILVSNHRSNQDPLVLGSVLPHHVQWVVAGYMRAVPISGWLMARMGMVFLGEVPAHRRAFLREATALLRRGRVLGVFPEGESYIFKNDFSAPMAPFERGFSALAVLAGVDVVPAFIRPIDESLRSVKLPSSIRDRISGGPSVIQVPRYRAVRVVFGPPISARSTGVGESHLAKNVRAAMEELQTVSLCSS